MGREGEIWLRARLVGKRPDVHYGAGALYVPVEGRTHIHIVYAGIALGGRDEMPFVSFRNDIHIVGVFENLVLGYQGGGGFVEVVEPVVDTGTGVEVSGKDPVGLRGILG